MTAFLKFEGQFKQHTWHNFSAIINQLIKLQEPWQFISLSSYITNMTTEIGDQRCTNISFYTVSNLPRMRELSD